MNNLWTNVKIIIQGRLTSSTLGRWPRSQLSAAYLCSRLTPPQEPGWLMCSRRFLHFALWKTKSGTRPWHLQPLVRRKALWCQETMAIGRLVGHAIMLFCHSDCCTDCWKDVWGCPVRWQLPFWVVAWVANVIVRLFKKSSYIFKLHPCRNAMMP